MQDPVWQDVRLEPSSTCADGDCLLHSVSRDAAYTHRGWCAPPEAVRALRRAVAAVMRQHRAALVPLNIYHSKDFERYCDAYETSAPGRLPVPFWPDDCAVAALAHHLGTALIKCEPCSDSTLLFTIFRDLKRQESVEKAAVLELLRSPATPAVLVYFDGFNHYHRCVETSEAPATPAVCTLPCSDPMDTDGPLRSSGWEAEDANSSQIGPVRFYRELRRAGADPGAGCGEDRLEPGASVVWLDEGAAWRHGVAMAVYTRERAAARSCLTCLVQMAEVVDDTLYMGIFTEVEVEDDALEVVCGSWPHTMYRDSASLWVPAPEPRALRTLRFTVLEERLWEMIGRSWRSGVSLRQQWTPPCTQHRLYTKPARRSSRAVCALCGRRPGSLRTTVTVGKRHAVVEWCDACHRAAETGLTLQLQLREWYATRLRADRQEPIHDVVALNLIFPFEQPAPRGRRPAAPPVKWSTARAFLRDLLVG